MEVTEIRRLNIKYLADVKYGRAQLSELLGYQDSNYLNQLCGGFGAFGNRTARKIEAKLGLQKGWMDNLQPEGVRSPEITLKELWDSTSPEAREEFLRDLASKR